ncbi:hypothetical protein [Kitasatospora sp. NPDC094011]|uniref:hypothetical protein n=1 Tax=Kitasatospora sp. NPDC094011 TaxID=3364090 RepID=UPI003823B584
MEGLDDPVEAFHTVAVGVTARTGSSLLPAGSRTAVDAELSDGVGGLGDQRDTRNEISHSTIHGNVFMGGIVSLLAGRLRPRPDLVPRTGRHGRGS